MGGAPAPMGGYSNAAPMGDAFGDFSGMSGGGGFAQQSMNNGGFQQQQQQQMNDPFATFTTPQQQQQPPQGSQLKNPKDANLFLY